MTTRALRVQGMHCSSCKTLIEDVCKELPGVLSCTVDLQTGEAVIEHNEQANMDTVIKEIGGLGDYQVSLMV